MAVPPDNPDSTAVLPDSRVPMAVPPDSPDSTVVLQDSRVSLGVLRVSPVSLAVLQVDRQADRVPRAAVSAVDARDLPEAEDSVRLNLPYRWKRNGCRITIRTRRTTSVSTIRNM